MSGADDNLDEVEVEWTGGVDPDAPEPQLEPSEDDLRAAYDAIGAPT